MLLCFFYTFLQKKALFPNLLIFNIVECKTSIELVSGFIKIKWCEMRIIILRRVILINYDAVTNSEAIDYKRDIICNSSTWIILKF